MVKPPHLSCRARYHSAVREGIVVLRNELRRVVLLRQNRNQLDQLLADGGPGSSATLQCDRRTFPKPVMSC